MPLAQIVDVGLPADLMSQAAASPSNPNVSTATIKSAAPVNATLSGPAYPAAAM